MIRNGGKSLREVLKMYFATKRYQFTFITQAKTTLRVKIDA